MPNAYVNLATMKGPGGLDVRGINADAELLQLIEAMSRSVDAYVGRSFYPYRATLYLSGSGGNCLRLLEDLVSVTSLTEDEQGSGSGYATTWAATDYLLAPSYANPTHSDPDQAMPYTAIEADRRSSGTKSGFGRGQKRFAIAGVWGYLESLRSSGATLSAGINDSVTSVTVSNATPLSAGDTIKVGDEYLYITGVSGNTLIVQRGVNGSTAAAHDSGAALSVIQYPATVRMATQIEVARMWTMRGSGYASQVGDSETGVVQIFGGALHARARALLDPYRRLMV